MPLTIPSLEIETRNRIPKWWPSVFRNGSSFISAVEWDISSKCGRQIDFHILNQIPSLKLNPEVHLEKSIWRHNSVADRPITTKFGRQMENETPMTIHTGTSKSKPGIEFQYGSRTFSETGSSFISAMDWDISSILIVVSSGLKQLHSLSVHCQLNMLQGMHRISIWTCDPCSCEQEFLFLLQSY